LIYWLANGDITKFDQVKKIKLRFALNWLWCKFKEEDDQRRFTAACAGAEIKESVFNKPEAKGGVRSIFALMNHESAGQTKFDVERVKVSPEEIARRELDNAKGN
jgi:hypothetical protein